MARLTCLVGFPAQGPVSGTLCRNPVYALAPEPPRASMPREAWERHSPLRVETTEYGPRQAPQALEGEPLLPAPVDVLSMLAPSCPGRFRALKALKEAGAGVWSLPESTGGLLVSWRSVRYHVRFRGPAVGPATAPALPPGVQPAGPVTVHASGDPVDAEMFTASLPVLGQPREPVYGAPGTVYLEPGIHLRFQAPADPAARLGAHWESSAVFYRTVIPAHGPDLAPAEARAGWRDAYIDVELRPRDTSRPPLVLDLRPLSVGVTAFPATPSTLARRMLTEDSSDTTVLVLPSGAVAGERAKKPARVGVPASLPAALGRPLRLLLPYGWTVRIMYPGSQLHRLVEEYEALLRGLLALAAPDPTP